MKPYKKIIVALDLETQSAALALVKKLKGKVGVFKVGKELFTACGPDIIKKIHKLGGKVFLDLKFHDIPNTMAKAVAQAVKLGVYMLTVHISSGCAALEACAKAAKANAAKNKPVIILGVTILTSLDEEELKKLGFKYGAAQMVTRMAKMAKAAGIGGIVSSPKEVKNLRRVLGKNMVLVTPGVRPAWAAAGDQKRIMTPKEAVKAGADYLVIGRPITTAKKPAESAQLIAKEIGG